MNDSKQWYTSRGVWGSLVAMVASLSVIFHIDFNAPVQEELTDILTGAGGLVGSALSLYGRVMAVTQVLFPGKQSLVKIPGPPSDPT